MDVLVPVAELSDQFVCHSERIAVLVKVGETVMIDGHCFSFEAHFWNDKLVTSQSVGNVKIMKPGGRRIQTRKKGGQ